MDRSSILRASTTNDRAPAGIADGGPLRARGKSGGSNANLIDCPPNAMNAFHSISLSIVLDFQIRELDIFSIALILSPPVAIITHFRLASFGFDSSNSFAPASMPIATRARALSGTIQIGYCGRPENE